MRRVLRRPMVRTPSPLPVNRSPNPLRLDSASLHGRCQPLSGRALRTAFDAHIVCMLRGMRGCRYTSMRCMTRKRSCWSAIVAPSACAPAHIPPPCGRRLRRSIARSIARSHPGCMCTGRQNRLRLLSFSPPHVLPSARLPEGIPSGTPVHRRSWGRPPSNQTARSRAIPCRVGTATVALKERRQDSIFITKLSINLHRSFSLPVSVWFIVCYRLRHPPNPNSHTFKRSASMKAGGLVGAWGGHGRSPWGPSGQAREASRVLRDFCRPAPISANS